MKKRLNIFLGLICTLTLVLTACFSSEGNKTNPTSPTTTNLTDTTFIKSIKWDSLNKFVDFHILRKGNKTTDTNFHFNAKTIAAYHYYNNQFDPTIETTELNFNPGELKELILTDSFSDRKNFECLLRINSHIGYSYRPDLLQTVIVKTKDMSDKNIKRVVTDLKKENFVQEIKIELEKQTSLDTLLNNTTKIVLIKIKLKPEYSNLRSINEVCDQLKKRIDVDQAFFTDFFTGFNEMEIIYHLKSR